MRLFKKCIKIFFISIFIVFLMFTIDTIYENINVKYQIKNFTDSGVFIQQIDDFYLYEVEVDYELNSPSINFNEYGLPITSTPGDIFIYRESTLDENFPNILFLKYYISYYFGGHAGVIVDEFNTIETNGAYSEGDKNIVDLCENNIMYSPSNRDVVGLRVDASKEDVDKSLNYLHNAVGKPYNYTFIFNKANSYYCTDLVARAYGKEAGLPYDLDVDGIATSCNDLIISKDTCITYYMVYNGSEKHLYYAV